MIMSRIAVLALFAAASPATAQFIDTFDGEKIVRDSSAMKGWSWFAGDGEAVMNFSESGIGYSTITVDATSDKRGIWWAVIKRCVSGNMDLAGLSEPRAELRIEAKVKVSDAPKRINLSLNTNRTTDFHSNLMEFDIADTSDWHTVSFTTSGFDAAPGDTVYGQLALMDWGPGKYRVDVDYFKVDMVDSDTAGPDKGVQVPYHPPLEPAFAFANRLPVVQDGMVDVCYPDMPVGNWSVTNGGDTTRLLTVDGERLVLLRWDFSRYAGRIADGAGMLELTSHSVLRSTDYDKDFGMIRVCEITGGDPSWNGRSATYNSFTSGEASDRVINSQMIIDVPVNPVDGGTNLIAISNPVLQRLIDGRTLGIAIKPLGAVTASFYGREGFGGTAGAAIYFNVVRDSSEEPSSPR